MGGGKLDKYLLHSKEKLVRNSETSLRPSIITYID